MTEDNSGIAPREGGQPEQPPPPPTAPPEARPPKRSRGKLVAIIILGVLLSFSVVLNGYLVFLVAVFVKARIDTATLRKGKKDQTVAVYEVTGFIGDKTVEEFEAFFKAVENDEDVKAVVLRVNSPGGAVSASDQIYDKVKRLQRSGKKVVVSMGGMATSGGYYISAPADHIVAEPTTTTGSIGVILVIPVIKGTLEKVGIEMVVMKSDHAEMWKDEGSPLDHPTEKQREHLRQLLNKTQSRFEQIVEEARCNKLLAYRSGGEDATETRPAPKYEAFNGKVYAADEAREMGLIDGIGYQDDAIDKAASLANLSEPRVLRYRKAKSVMERLSSRPAMGGLDIDADFLHELQTPRVLLMWKVE